MANEELRNRIIKGIDRILEAPWVIRRLLGTDDVRLLRALRTFAQNADDSVLSEIDKCLAREPMLAEGTDLDCPDHCCPHCKCGWRKGPMPPDTWNWGGVIDQYLDRFAGFEFADFRGDHVIANPHTKDERRINAKDVLWYNNCLELRK